MKTRTFSQASHALGGGATKKTKKLSIELKKKKEPQHSQSMTINPITRTHMGMHVQLQGELQYETGKVANKSQ